MNQKQNAIANIEELERYAQVFEDQEISMEAWIAKANRLYDQAGISKDKGDLENAYIQYLKFTNIVNFILPRRKVKLRKRAFEVTYILKELKINLTQRFENNAPRSSYGSNYSEHDLGPSNKNSDTQGLTLKYSAITDASGLSKIPSEDSNYSPKTNVQKMSSDFNVGKSYPIHEGSSIPQGRYFTEDSTAIKPFTEYTYDSSTHEYDDNELHESMLKFPQVEHIHDVSFTGTKLNSDLDINRISQRFPSLDHVESLSTPFQNSHPDERFSQTMGKEPAQNLESSKVTKDFHISSQDTRPEFSGLVMEGDHKLPWKAQKENLPLSSASIQTKKQVLKGSLDKTRFSFKSRTNSRRWSSSVPISQSSFAFPHATVISTSALHQYLWGTSTPPLILLMDIRPREEFQKSHIDAKYIINIDPMILENETTSSKIEAALLSYSKEEQSLFNERHKFDLIAFYDQSSTSLTQRPVELGGDLMANPLQHLLSAIYEREFEKVLIRMPVLLSGGYQTWKAQYGEGPSKQTPAQSHNSAAIHKVDANQNDSVDWFNQHQDSHTDGQHSKMNEHKSLDQIDMLADRLNRSAVIATAPGRPVALETYDYFQHDPVPSEYTTYPPYPGYGSNIPKASSQHGYNSSAAPPLSLPTMPNQAYLPEPSKQSHEHPPRWYSLQQHPQYRTQSLDQYRPLIPQVVSQQPQVNHQRYSLPLTGQKNIHPQPSSSSRYPYMEEIQQHFKRKNMSKVESLVMPQPEYPYSSTSDQIQKPSLAFSCPQAPKANQAFPQQNGNNSSLRRRKTFLDNPYYGFTATNNTHYGPPPPPLLPKRPLPVPPVSQALRISQQIPFPQQNQYHSQQYLARPTFTHEQTYGGQPPKLPMRGPSPTFESSVSQLGSVRVGITGLKNLGNTCFMNSILQCLSATVPLARYFLDGSYKRHINSTNFLGTGGVLAQAFGDLIRVMWSVQYTFVSPITFRDAIGRFAPQFKGSDQQDSQELLGFLLDGLHEDLNLIVTKPPPDKNDDDDMMENMPEYLSSDLAWEKYLLRNSSIIVSLFQGQFRSKLQCTYCKQTSTTYNPFTYLSLPIPLRNNGVPLSRCLDEFVKEEILDGDDAWFCSRCKTRRRAIKRLTLSRLPDVLLIHLKRFSFSGPFRDKLDTLVSYPLKKLDMRPYLPSTTSKAPAIYDLYAVSNHFGGLNGGHYTAQVRNGYRDQWHNFDDSRVSVCDERSIVSKSAYILFYVRSTIS
ncbi:ubiquitin-specific protease doa4 [Basidiobolus ranarum]|uniref:ubiquitinyl hydrolase 1 n=1 Tax=Basidiobolus ranarum TaxID=34480 RepID=A0ABR2WA89_9FUNG